MFAAYKPIDKNLRPSAIRMRNTITVHVSSFWTEAKPIYKTLTSRDEPDITQERIRTGN